MANSPLVSIIIPVYNVDSYLEACIESVKYQTYDNIQVIFIDDGSTDKSGSILDSYKFDDNYIVIHQPNQGVSAARNAGIDRATGDVITFIDSDDVVNDVYIEKLVSIMGDSKDISMCGFTTIEEDGTASNIEPDESNLQIKDVSSKQALVEIFYGSVLDSGPFCKMFRRSIVDDVRYDVTLKIGEDLDFLYRILINKELNIAYTRQRLYGYRVRKQSAMTDRYSTKYHDYLSIVEQYYDESVEKNPELVDSIRYRLFGIASFNVGKMGRKYKDFSNEYMHCNVLLKRHSKSVITNPRSSNKNKVLATGYMVNARLTSWIRSNIISKQGV